MSETGLDALRKAKEEEYFQKINREAKERLAKRTSAKPRLSPISGEPMVQETIHGVVVDRCLQSGGVFLDAGELEQIVLAEKNANEAKSSWLGQFVRGLTKS